MSTMTYTGELVLTMCWCGTRLGVPSELHRVAKNEGHEIYCPLGHQFVFRDTLEKKLAATEQRLAEEKRRVSATRDLLAQEERSHAATRGHLTRHRKRASAGVCPCCNRTFQQLARHMKTKHPGFKPEEIA